ncbi:hypothetical protein QTN47_11255 [Danxiaibacter flavus]|uniref:Uncharacterized protein n=1 Tax=Danxiaibacter flavus TaxID=3049108 RepID=A0ABV3ZDX0_9BACT|nr:hypothetical protein QNM32_11260 [Chitinophagaceae bacterium DXS]
MDPIKKIPGKDFVGNNVVDTDLNLPIQDNSAVAGYGLPITLPLCRQIFSDYDANQQQISSFLSQLPPSPPLDNIIAGLDPSKQVAAGIYGREALLDILSQAGCEGIMYINCIYDQQDSIILLGVDSNGNPIGGAAAFAAPTRAATDPVIYEVKGGAQTRDQVKTLLGI